MTTHEAFEREVDEAFTFYGFHRQYDLGRWIEVLRGWFFGESL